MSGYNWFKHDAVSNLLLLLGIDPARVTPEQRQQAERVIDSTMRYVRSVTGR